MIMILAAKPAAFHQVSIGVQAAIPNLALQIARARKRCIDGQTIWAQNPIPTAGCIL
jgi:hypothetical protein